MRMQVRYHAASRADACRFMKQLFDLFPVGVFLAAYYLTGKDMLAATGAIMVASAVQLALGYAIWRRVDRMHLVVFALLIVFGSLTLLLSDPIFIKWKPTVVNMLFATVLFAGQFFGEKNIVQRLVEGMLVRGETGLRIVAPPATWRAVNAAAMLFFLGCAGLNLYIAYHFSDDTWMLFRVWGLWALNATFMVALFVWLYRYAHEDGKTSS
jgi:intracellular septation protein